MTRRNATFLLGIACLGCAKQDESRAASESASSTVSVSEPAATGPQVLAGPRLVSDSAATQPFFKVEASALVLHVPANMAQAINDSLPDFAPVERGAYEASLVQLADESAKESRELEESANDSLGRYALSAAIGDFDGDSTSDVAILGNSHDSTATIFVLAQSHSRQRPQIIFIARPRAADHLNREWRYLSTVRAGPVRVFDEEDDKSPPFQLPSDGVQVAYFEKGAEVFFLDHGVVKSLITSD